MIPVKDHEGGDDFDWMVSSLNDRMIIVFPAPCVPTKEGILGGVLVGISWICQATQDCSKHVNLYEKMRRRGPKRIRPYQQYQQLVVCRQYQFHIRVACRNRKHKQKTFARDVERLPRTWGTVSSLGTHSGGGLLRVLEDVNMKFAKQNGRGRGANSLHSRMKSTRRDVCRSLFMEK